jgi:hypothetical protein
MTKKINKIITSVAITLPLILGACGGSSKVGKEDAEGCKELVVMATGTINDINYWMRQQPDTQGTRAGYDAAREVGNSMAGTSLKAKELSAASSSGSTKKIYDKVESTVREAALAIAARGGSLGPSEAALLTEAADSAEKMNKFCGGE